MAKYLYMNGFTTRPPKPPTDTVLPVTINVQMPVAFDDRLLNLFFQNPRFNPLPVIFAGYHMLGNIIAYHSVTHWFLHLKKVPKV
jgi:hypothetical protein